MLGVSPGRVGQIGQGGDAGLQNAATGVLNALSRSKRILQNDSADLNWVLAGDSTANQLSEWQFLWFSDLAAQHPAFTFIYVPPDAAGGYGTPVTLQEGSGAHTFRFYCNGVGGQNSQYLMGGLFDGAFISPGYDWDLVLWNYGKNQVTGAVQPLVQGEFLGSIAQVQLAFPDANHLVTDQYPNRDDAAMALAHSCWTDIVASDATISVFDQYSDPDFVSGDYLDNNHLTDAANAAKLLPRAQALWAETRAGDFAPSAPWLSAVVLNLLNGDANEAYSDFAQNGNGTLPGAANVLPAGYALTGTVAFSQEPTITWRGAARAQKMQGSGATQARIRRSATAAKLAVAKGNWITLTVINYVPAGAAGGVGRQGLFTDGTGGGAYSTRVGAVPKGGYRVQVLGPLFLANDATFIRHDNYHDSAAAPDATHPTYTQAAHLAIGKLPRIH